MEPKQADNQVAQPLTELEGFFCPSIIPTAVVMNGECPNPLDKTSMAGHAPIKSIARIRNGRPDENGPDVRVERKDGTRFDICNAPISFSYKLDPIEVRLERNEIVTLAHQLWNLEQGGQYDDESMQRIEISRSRAVRHNQKPEVQEIVEGLRRNKQRLALIRELDSPAVPAEDAQIGEEAAMAAGQAADIM